MELICAGVNMAAIENCRGQTLSIYGSWSRRRRRVPVLKSRNMVFRNNTLQYQSSFQYRYLFLYQRILRGIKNLQNVGFLQWDLKFSFQVHDQFYGENQVSVVCFHEWKCTTYAQRIHRLILYGIMDCALIHHRKMLNWHWYLIIKTSISITEIPAILSPA